MSYSNLFHYAVEHPSTSQYCTKAETKLPECERTQAEPNPFSALPSRPQSSPVQGCPNRHNHTSWDAHWAIGLHRTQTGSCENVSSISDLRSDQIGYH